MFSILTLMIYQIKINKIKLCLGFNNNNSFLQDFNKTLIKINKFNLIINNILLDFNKIKYFHLDFNKIKDFLLNKIIKVFLQDFKTIKDFHHNKITKDFLLVFKTIKDFPQAKILSYNIQIKM